MIGADEEMIKPHRAITEFDILTRTQKRESVNVLINGKSTLLLLLSRKLLVILTASPSRWVLLLRFCCTQVTSISYQRSAKHPKSRKGVALSYQCRR